MKKKIKDNLFILSAVLAAAIFATLYSIARKAMPAVLLLPVLVLVFTSIRIMKVLRKNALEYLNGPKRFCEGKGIEIGSGGHPMIEGSLLVDVANDFSSEKPYRVDYIADAHCLPEIGDDSLDYVCASNVLEHLTNPIKAILEWIRILKPKGVMWLKIPDKRKTFDKLRERTKLGHLIEDFEKNVSVDDPTHINDHNDNSLPPRKEAHPYIHNHVWVMEDMTELFGHIHENHFPVRIIGCSENTCKNAQDFWIVVQKS